MTTSSRLELVVDASAASQHLQRLEKELQRLDGRGSATTAMMGKMSLAIGAISAAAGGLGFSRIIRETASFEDAMLGLQAVSGATTKQMADLEKQARTLGATSTFSAEQAGNAQRYLAQAGFEVNEVLEATPGLLNLAAAGQMDLAQAADIASNILGAMRLEVDQLNRVNDVLAATAAGANTNISQLGLALSYAAPFAAAAGVSLEDTAAAIGAMSDAGIQAGRAGTGLVGIIRELSRITPATAKGLESAGLAVKDVDISTRGLLPVLETLNQAGLNVTQSIEIFGSEAGAAAINVIEASDTVAVFSEKLQNAEGAAKEMALIIESGLTGSMKSFSSMVSESIIKLGRDDGLAAGFQSVTDTASGVLAIYNDLLPEFAEANGLTQTQIDRIEMLAGGFDLLKDAAMLAAGVMTARFVSSMAAGTVSIYGRAKANAANLKAEAAATQAVTRRTGAELLAQKRLHARALAEERATRGTAAHTGALARLNAQRQAGVQAATAHTLATNNAAAAMTRASVSAQALAGAGRAASGALALVGGPVGAAVLAGAAIYYFRDALGITSAAARENKQEIDELIKSLENYTQAQYESSRVSIVQTLAEARVEASKLQTQIDELNQQSQNQGMWYQGFSGSATHDIAELNTQLREQNRVIAANEQGLREYDQAWQGVLQGQISGVSIFRTLDQWLFDTGESAQRTSREFSALSYALGTGGEGWDDYISKLRGARDVLGMTADEAAAYAAQQQGFTGVYSDLAAAVAGQTDALEGYRRAIAAGNDEEAQAHLDRARRFAEAEAMVQAQLLNMETLTNLLKGVQTELSAVALTSALTVADAGGAGAAYLANAIRMINERASAIQRTTTITQTNIAANREAREAERALANAERERQRVLDDSISAYADLFKQLSPAGAATAEYNATVARLTVAYEDGTKSALEYYAAIGQAAKIHNDAVRAADPNIKRVEQLSQQYDRAFNRGQQLATAVDDISAAYRRGDIDGDQYARMMGNVRDEMQQLALESDPLAQEMARSWEEAAKRIDETFADAFTGAFDSFESFADQLAGGFERLLGELAYAAAKNQIMVGFGIGGSANGQPGGQQGGMSLQNINPAMLKKGWDTASGWFSGGQSAGGGLYANANTGAAQGGLYGNISTQSAQSGWAGGSMQNYQGMGAVYNMGASMAGGYVGGEVGSSVTGKTANSNYGETAGSLIGSYWGPWGAAAGSAIGSFVDSLFGSNKKTFDFDFLQGQHSYVFGDGTSAFGDYGLTGLSDYKLGEQQDALKEMLAALGQFDNQIAALAVPKRFDAMKAAIEGFTHSGPEDLFETRLKTMIQGGEVWAADAVASIADPEKLSQALLAALQLEQLGGVLGAELSAEIKDAISSVRGDQAAGVVQSTLAQAQAADLLINSVERLNLQFDKTAQGALAAAGGLSDYVGGLDSFAAMNSAYYQAAFSESERLSFAQADLLASLRAVTDEAPRTVEELRAIVEAQSLNGEASQRLAADLMALAPALKETTAAVRQAIEQQYQAALGRTPADSGLDYWFNLVADGSITLEDALWNIANSAEAADYAANGAATGIDNMADALRTQEQLNRQLLQAQGNTTALRQLEIDRLGELENAEVDNLITTQRRIWAIEDEKVAQQEAERAQQERIRAIEQEANAMARAREQLASFGVSIDNWLANLNGTDAGMGAPADQLAATSAAFEEQYAKAQTGDRDALGSITQYADRFIDAQKGWSASGTQTAATIDRVTGMLEALPERLSAEQFLAEEFKGIIGEQTVSLVDVMDLNGDGTVNAIERSISAAWDADDLLKGVLHHEMQLLGTTVLTESQIRTALRPHATNAEIDRLIKRVDMNGDGFVSQQELTNDRLGGLTSGFANAIANEFDQIDLDVSGLIDYDEFRHAFAGMATDAELRNIFDELDKNGDGAIDRLEAQTRQLMKGVKASDLTDSEQSIVRALNAQQNESVVRWWGHHIANEFDRKFSGHRGLGVSLASKQDPSGVNYIAGVHSSRMLSGDNVRWLGHSIANEFKRAGVANGGKAYWEGGYTGPGSKYQPAGTVHAGEIVWSQDDIARAGGVDTVEALRNGRAELSALHMRIPDGPLPMPNIPLPHFPTLGNSDALQVLQDVKRELQESRKETKRLQEENNRHAAAAVAVQQAGFNGQINEAEKSSRALADIASDARLRGAL